MGSILENAVLQFSAWPSMTLERRFGSNAGRHLSHPAGTAVYGESIFVASQNTRAILEFDLKNGKYIRTVVRNLPDDPESIIFSGC